MIKEETKQEIVSVKRKNLIVSNIIETIANKDNFLVLGHHNADEDCISSMIAIAILIKKFSKIVDLYLPEPVHEKYNYLMAICRHNSIGIIKSFSDIKDDINVLAIMDTPKPEMLQDRSALGGLLTNNRIVKIEIDHHIDADSRYIGDPGFRLVTYASSASELVGYIAMKLNNRDSFLAQYQVGDIFSRNLVLAVLTGMIGDSKMGKFLKSRREQWFYDLFSREFSRMLKEKTKQDSVNLSSMEEVYNEIFKLSKIEEAYFNFFMDRKGRDRFCSYTLLAPDDMIRLPPQFDVDLFISSARAVADTLAEESGYISMVAYYEPPGLSDLVQFRLRRSHSFKRLDLRDILKLHGIKNGGGHEGAIGFRIEKDKIVDLKEYANPIIASLNRLISDCV